MENQELDRVFRLLIDNVQGDIGGFVKLRDLRQKLSGTIRKQHLVSSVK